MSSTTIPDREPVSVLAGFFGSAKIELLNRLPSEGHARRADGADGDEAAGDRAVPGRLCGLERGYVYCAVRGDPIRVLGALMRRRDPIDHVLVETTGLADPAPVLRTLLDEPSAQAGRSAAVTVVDALQLSLQLDPPSLPLPPGAEAKGGEQEQNASVDVVLLDLDSRDRARDHATEEALARPGRYREVREGLRVKEVVISDGERRRRHVVCHMPAEERRQRQHRAKLLSELEAELSLGRREGGPLPRRAPALLASDRYGRYLRESAGGKLRIDRAAIADAERHDGKWVVTSSDDTLSAEDLALAHERFVRVEACWNALGSTLRSRPIRRLHPWPTRIHLMMSVLALILERVTELPARGAWRDLADALHQIEVVDVEPAPAIGVSDVRRAEPIANSA
jgi:hypothetical protein